MLPNFFHEDGTKGGTARTALDKKALYAIVQIMLWKFFNSDDKNKNLTIKHLLYHKSYFLLLACLFFFFNCSEPASKNSDFCETLKNANSFFSDILHNKSEALYDGNGTWGETQYGYKSMLRDVVWRLESYFRLSKTQHAHAALYSQRSSEILAYLKSVQDAGGNGVWGIPAEPNHPEFGTDITTILNTYPEAVHNGWITGLTGNYASELYYDHGRALTAFSRVFLKDGNTSLLPYITKAANWILDKPAVTNVNYNSAVIEGLCYAYLAVSDTSYLNKAVQLSKDGVFPYRNTDGSYGNVHNQLAHYHGFIVSGLIALKRALPPDSNAAADIDSHLNSALKRLEDLTVAADAPNDATWPGIVSRVWTELADLCSEGKWQALTDRQLSAQNNCIKEVLDKQSFLQTLNGYPLQKALYHYIQIGIPLSKYLCEP